MPMATLQGQRAYQREWVARRRAEWLADRACIDCGTTERLEVDHVDPAQKIDHRIWSWSLPRRTVELAKCVVRCETCHRDRHAAERRVHGIKRYEKGCRCEVCRATKAASNRRHRENVARRASRESNSGGRLCRPPRSHSATGPGAEAYSEEAEAA